MAAKSPKDLRIRIYDVGFGDCFLLTFRYATGSPREKHVLIDFGSTASAKKTPLIGAIADDIEKVTGGRLDAIVVSHRHQDHISGFSTGGGKKPGDVIRRLAKNALILQPWTEDPKVPPKATSPSGTSLSVAALQSAFVTSLERMHEVAESVAAQARRLRPADIEATPGGEGQASEPGAGAPTEPDEKPGESTPALESREREAVGKRLQALLSFLGETNLKNLSAIKNLMGMSTPKRHRYLSYGDRSGLETVLPGVKVDVLGPPTIQEYKKVLAQRRTDPEEFWHLQAAAARLAARPGRGVLFPRVPRAEGDPPQSARWFVRRMRGIHAQQLLELVRIVDDYMNNTSLILLFTVGNKRLLFPGDAQIENWEYALKVSDEKKKNRAALSGVGVYKVGHHGSLNATPKTLWAGFKKKKKKGLETLLSTRPGKHGHLQSGTEVPRKPLMDALKANSTLHSTTDLAGTRKEFFEDVTLKFG